MKRSAYVPFLMLTMTLVLTACDAKGPLPSPDTTPPTVRFTNPANGSANIPINLSGITITFSEAMDQSTINDTTMTLEDSDRSNTVLCSVKFTDLAGTTYDLVPSLGLSPNTQYRVVVGAGVKDKFGNAMGAPFIVSFHTGTLADTTPPVIETTYPAAGSAGVPANSSPRVTFSEPVIPQTIDFTLTQGTTTIPGTMSYSGTTAVFTPANVLVANAIYTARVAGGDNGVRDLVGNLMLADYTWTFTTAQDTTPPTVTATTPASGGSNIGVNAAISVTFSEPVDQTSIAFSLRIGGGPPAAGSLTYSGTTAIFTPQSVLAYNTQYTATVSAGLKDLAGNSMTADHSWTFTTGIAPDKTPPTVTATSPAAGSTNVGINASLSFTFSEPVNQTTIPFTLSAGAAAVPGSLTYSGTTAIFTPSAPLNYSTLYTGKVSAGVQDLAGNAMPGDYYWSFTTGTAPDTTPPTVTATTPASGGSNIGVNAAISVTFSEPVDQATIQFALSAGAVPVTGSLTYSGTTAVFTPQSVLAYNTQYTATVSAGLRDLAGNAMAGTYSWTFTTGIAPDRTPPTVTATSPAAGSTNVGINASLSFTFSEPVNQTTIPFTLSAGAAAVPGSLTYSGTTAIFTPSAPLNYSTLYTGKVSAGVQDLAGNAMPGDYYWSFTTGTAPDTTPPTVTATTPASGGSNIGVNAAISVTFSEPVDQATIQFALSAGAVPVTGSLTYSGTTAVFTPQSVLAYNTQYTATVSAGLRDLAGNAMAGTYSWTFTTGIAPDRTPPTVTATSPAAGSTNVGINASLSFTFSEPVNQTTIPFTLSAGAAAVPGSLTYSGTTAIFTPSAPLNYSTLYTGKVSAGVQDLAGNAMPGDYYWSFTTGTAPDTTPPTVTATTPASGGSNIGVNAAISVTFSEPVDQATIQFALSAGAVPVTGSLTYSGTTAVFTPQSVLAYNTQYTATVSAGLKDLAGNMMTADHSWTFTTGIAPDRTPPTVTATSPAAGSTNVGINASLSFTFSEPVNQTTIPFTLSAGAAAVPGSLTYSGTTAIFTPSAPLNYSTLYTGKVSAGVQDLAGNAMPGDYYWSFTTGTAPDTTPPFVIATTPGAGAVDVPLYGALSATFSEPVDQTSILFTLTDGTTAIPCTTTYNGTTAIFTPSSMLANATTYTATVAAGVQDLAGNGMTSDHAWTFTTQ